MNSEDLRSQNQSEKKGDSGLKSQSDQLSEGAVLVQPSN